MIDIIRELIEFLLHRKKIWLIPIFLTFFIFGILIVLTEGSVMSPFIYTLF
ncbi:DUF5989 family protein [Alphaproteobacteria bacterium]|nr:DUF5989 family protein [Alphaproteobacteria bacterium]